MTLPYLTCSGRAAFAEAAAFQRDERERKHPGAVAAKRMTAAEAQADYRAWVAIARWCAGEPIGFEISFDEMAKATARAVTFGDKALAREPHNPDVRERCRAVAGIHALIGGYRGFLAETNAILRARAERDRKAA